MTFDVEVDGRAARLNVLRDGDSWRFRLDDEAEREAMLAEVEPGVFSVLIGGKSYEAHAETGQHCAWITIRGRRMRVVVRDPRQWIRQETGAHGQPQEQIVAAMPGKIVRILVKPGETVESGQGIVVVEAMKMQNEMKTRRGGRITAIPVREGETVTAGTVLAIIE